jgi:hypothetical protein
MQALHEIIGRLTDEERARLRGLHEARGNVVSRMIIEALDEPVITREEFITRHAITPSTYSKSQSQAVDAIHEMLGAELRNPYDPIMLIRLFLFRGLVKEAKKQFFKLEKEYLRQHLYPVLDTLYHEGVRICYHTGDTRWLGALVEKINTNSALLKEYNALDTPLILEMLKLERKRLGEAIASVGEMRAVLARAERLGHPVLIHNSLYCLYTYYTQHHFDVGEALEVARAILRNAERHRDSIDAYTVTMAYNNYAHFLCTYIVEESPEPYYASIAAKIGMGGTLERVDFFFQYFHYYLFTGNRARAVGTLARMRETPLENRFALLPNVAAAWLAFDAGDADGFRAELAAFYAMPAYQDFPEHEFHLRAMEILLAARAGDAEFAAQRMESLRKFHYRNFQPAEDYRALINAMQRMVYAKLQGEHARRGGREKREGIALRSVAFLYELVVKESRREG